MPSKSHAPRGKAPATAGSSKDGGKGAADAKSGGKKGNQSSGTVTPAEEPKKPGKKGSKSAQDAKAAAAAAAAPSSSTASDPAKRPDTRTLIGGSSWTGKLPVNMLAEYCQKQKWDKPEYDMRRVKDGYISAVTLKSKNPKSGEVTVLPIIRFPQSRQGEVLEPTALEARHFAATYALFRMASMKNMHMMMPPKYKDLWKGLFAELKKEDVANGKAWQYEADPFLTAIQREEAEKARIKKREEEERLKAKQAEKGGPAKLGPGSKAWERAPVVDMGKRMRLDVEGLVRQQTVWNVNDVSLPANTVKTIVEEMVKLGFRKSHIQEAAEICKDKEEILEWLLIHVPEDDLPSWSLPENYVAGVSMASSDLKRDATIRRLASAGYARDLCEEQLDAHGGIERKAASALQAQLLQLTDEDIISAQIESTNIESEGEDVWSEEKIVLASIYGDRILAESEFAISIQLEIEGLKEKLTVDLQKPMNGYPNSLPILSIQGKLAAYIRLSITRRALEHARDVLIGEQMMFNLVDWLEQNIPSIIAEPGRLSAVSGVTGAGEAKPVQRATRRQKRRHPPPIDWKSGSPLSLDLREKWLAKQSDPLFKKLLDKRKALPAWQVQEDIVQAVLNNPVTIISGETGSGKSTQSMQFILDDLIMNKLGSAANIICTQPRRISALGLADRVAEERGETVGNEVGYIIRGDNKVKRGFTRITFVTTGVLLRRLQTSGGTEKDIDDALADVSHVVIDEVHERAVDADFLLVLLKGVLRRRNDLKVVLMSATVDAGSFERYFSEVGTVGRVHVRGRTYPVTDFYKDDLIRMTGYNPGRSDENDGEMDDKTVSQALRDSGMRTDYELIARTVEHIDRELGKTEGGILVFLPGTMEIDRAIQTIRRGSQFHALPLHASLPPNEQRRVFPPAPRGLRKVICATNVAETSITIPDIVAVIDTGRVKETTYDTATSTQKLTETWASRAACAQRRGRAGRVQEGICYKLFTRNAEAKMLERPDPEILRIPLEQLCLSVKSMGVKDVASFLASALTPPSSQAVDAALDKLTRVGALEDGELTALGKHLAMIPADLKCGKLLVLGTVFGCIDACLGIAALVTGRSPFVNPREKREEIKKVRFDFSPGSGDLIADLRAYEAWHLQRRKLNNRDLRLWTQDNFLSDQALREVDSNRTQFISALQEIGFLPLQYRPYSSDAFSSNSADDLNANSQNTPLLRALVSAALHPNLLSISFPATKFAASHTGTVALDPEARTIKFFAEDTGRVFVHPSSTCFEAKGWSSDVKFLSFWERFASGAGPAGARPGAGDGAAVGNVKAYARGVTPINAMSVLLFGGGLQVDTLGRGTVVDGWARVRGWARIGVLVGRVRRLLDTVLERRVDDPNGKVTENERKVLDVVRRLVERDGLDR